LRIVGPSRPIIHKVRDKNIWQIVIFLHQNKNKNPAGSEAFEKILNNMPADWIIDVDPDNIY